MDIDLMQTQSEYKYSREHTIESIKAMMPQLIPHVNSYIQSLTDYYNLEHDFTYIVNKEERVWKSKQDRYEEIAAMDLTDIVWALLTACMLKADVTFTEVVGKIYKKFEHNTDRQCMESASEFIAMLNDTPFINIVYPRDNVDGVLKIERKVNLTGEVVEYLKTQCFTLPSLVQPLEITSNNDSGYSTFKKSLILSNKFHTYTQNLQHINRANSVAFRLNTDVIMNTNPKFKIIKDECKEIKRQRYEQWQQLNTESIKSYVLFDDKVFYFSHAYCERGRTYSRGHQMNTQGDDYRKAPLELARTELIEI